MPLKQAPSFNEIPLKMLEVPQPAIKGVNLKDLEYEQDNAHSPYMINMMYRNGSFNKRYGQEVYKTLENNNVYAMIMYREHLISHCGTNIYIDDDEVITGGTNIPNKKGLFCLFNSKLYYFNDNIYEIYYDTDEYKLLKEKPSNWDTAYGTYYKYTNGQFVLNTDSEWKKSTYYKSNTNVNKYVCEITKPYVPTVVINRKPDGTEGNTSESYNMVGTGFQNNFHGDGSSKKFKLTDDNLDSGTGNVPKVTVDNEEWTNDQSLSSAKTFKVDYSKGEIELKTAAPSGTNNVEIIAYKHDKEWTDYHNQIMASKFYACFGGNNNSRLFVAGGKKSTYFYSEVYDVTYFPYTNYARVGNSADDITGFGHQYNVLFIFKPTEIYSLSYYQATSDTTTVEDQIGIAAFSSQVVNSAIGCDCPNTIQLINNQLTWFSSRVGVCTLVSTNVLDERNVRVISRNIERTNNLGLRGILDINLNGTTELHETVKSIDFDNKYFLVFPKENINNVVTDLGLCYVWDYEIAPYVVTSSKVTSPRDLAWFIFDKFYVNEFIKMNNVLVYSSTLSLFTGKLIKLNDTFVDLDFNEDGHGDSINAKYMTPFFNFNAPEYLKNVINLYIQVRGDTASVIDVYYYTDESSKPEKEEDSIRIGGKVWGKFSWKTFTWFTTSWATTFRRKCNLKKIQMCAFYFENGQEERDMSITHLSMAYKVVKFIK